MLRAGAPQVSTPPARRTQAGTLLLAALIVASAAWVALGVAMRRDYNHDEHQFIAAGALIAREGLLPYRDFAYFHAPTLALLYAALYRSTDLLLLAARLLNVAAVAGMVALLLGVSLARLQGLSRGRRLLAGSLVTLLLIATPAFLHAAGRAWNHDLPVLLALASFLAQLAALERDSRSRRGLLWSGIAGLLIGLAAGMRLTYAPLVLPLLLGPLLWRAPARRLLALTAAFGAGLVIGLLPLFVLFAQAPDAFLFGNLTYARLNTEWYRQTAGPQEASLARKLVDAAQFVLQPGNALLAAVTLLALLRVRGWRTARDLHLWLILWPFLLLGALAPTPAQLQYVYVLFPFLALGLILAFARDPRPGWMLALLAAATALAVVLALPRLAEGAATTADRSEWYPLKAHARGRLLADLAASGPPGSTFTLAPALALEGGAPIDPRTATGPFAWRIAPLLAPEERARYKVLGAAEFAALEPAPRALLTGLHGADASADADADAAQVAWAHSRGYIPVALPEEGTLWLSPMATWGDRIALAAHTFPQQPVDPTEPFVATLYLQAMAPLDRDYNLLLRGVTADGSEIFRFDGWPYGSPTSTWAVGDVWPDGHAITLSSAQGDLGAQIVRVELSFYDPATLETLGAPAPVAWLHVGPDRWGSRPAVTFGGRIALQEAAPGEASLADGSLRVPLRWRALDRMQTGYTVFVHVLDANGALVAQRDQQPLDGFYPTQAWRPGRTVADEVVVEVPPGAALPLRVLVGVYDPATGQRLPLDAGGDAFAYAEVGEVTADR